MPRALDKTISEILSKYGETPKEACWDCHGVWVVYHKAIERMAARAGITFDQPTVIEASAANKTAGKQEQARVRKGWCFPAGLRGA